MEINEMIRFVLEALLVGLVGPAYLTFSSILPLGGITMYVVMIPLVLGSIIVSGRSTLGNIAGTVGAYYVASMFVMMPTMRLIAEAFNVSVNPYIGYGALILLAVVYVGCGIAGWVIRRLLNKSDTEKTSPA